MGEGGVSARRCCFFRTAAAAAARARESGARARAHVVGLAERVAEVGVGGERSEGNFFVSGAARRRVLS